MLMSNTLKEKILYEVKGIEEAKPHSSNGV